MYPATFTFPPIVATALLEAAVTSGIGGCSTLVALLKLVDEGIFWEKKYHSHISRKGI